MKTITVRVYQPGEPPVARDPFALRDPDVIAARVRVSVVSSAYHAEAVLPEEPHAGQADREAAELLRRALRREPE